MTNIDREHMDCYRNMADVKRPSWISWIASLSTGESWSAMTIRLAAPAAASPAKGTNLRDPARLGFPHQPGDAAFDTAEGRPVSRFQVSYRGQDLGEFRLHVPGAHNVLNATAAIAVGIGLDIPAEQIRTALENFRGVDRRFQLRGKAAAVSVIDDYGHHPTEIRATLAAARQCGFRKIHVVFQPHRYTRTQLLMDQFSTAFATPTRSSSSTSMPPANRRSKALRAKCWRDEFANKEPRLSAMPDLSRRQWPWSRRSPSRAI